MKSVVGGREIDLTKDEVTHRMRQVPEEPIREHFVAIGEKFYPPKQALSHVTGWDRQSFTTMEAVRVLSRLGFACQRAGRRIDGKPAWVPIDSEDLEEQVPVSIDQRLFAAESALTVVQEALSGLIKRVQELELRVGMPHS